jgi:hypothetical protein
MSAVTATWPVAFQIDTNPAGYNECGWMNFDHLSLLLIQPLYEDLAL